MPNYNVQKYSQQLQKHKLFLNKFKIFPEKSRKVIYKSLLQLPLNHGHFLELTKPFKQLPQHTPNQQTAFIVNALTTIYPTLGNQWLPGLIYPFVKLFEEDSIVCFESSLTFLLNWYQPIYENYPNPSKKVMEFAKKFLNKLDKKISSCSQYTLSSVINPMILVCFTDVLNKQDSLQLLDFLIANPFSPEYFLCSAISIILFVQEDICKLSSVQDISKALRKQKKIDIQQIIIRAKDMVKVHKKSLQQIYCNVRFPLTKERYPIHEFLKIDIKRKNDVLQKAQYDQMSQLNTKYSQLESLLNYKLKQGLVANSQQIQNRYYQIQGQTIQHLKKMKQQHQMKLKALRQIQQKFKDQISQEQYSKGFRDSRNVSNDKNIRIIQRRGRLQKQIFKLAHQAKKIRELEEDLLNKINKVAENKKCEILESNKKLYNQQRSEDLYNC